MRIEIDLDRCTGHGRCYDVAPTFFDPDDEGRGTVRVHQVPDDDVAEARRAEVNCPERAVRIV